MEQNTLQERIQKTVLTKGYKKIADYMLEHQESIGFITVAQLAMEIGVSDTSIIRLLRLLGYSGYSDFRRKMADQMMHQYKSSKEYISPTEKYLKTNETLDKKEVIFEVMNKSVSNITKAFENIDPEYIRSISQCILKSKRKYIVGIRGATSCANYFSRKLALIQPNVTCCDRAESVILEQIIDISKNDCLIMYTFPRYSEINYTILKLARERGAKIILITDSSTSPLCIDADFVLALPTEGVGITISYIVPMCITEALLLLISKGAKPEDKKRMELLDKVVADSKLY